MDKQNMDTPLLTPGDIYAVIREDENLFILEESEDGLIVEDAEDGKEIPVHFLEHMNADKLSEMIHISPDIPDKYQIDKTVLADYLWNTVDKNMFVTLNELVIIWGDGERDDAEQKRLYDETYDEFALFLSEGVLGQLWFDQNIVCINMKVLSDTAREIEEENSDLYDSFFYFENQLLTGFLTTAIHELRHLGLETNLFLSEEDYPPYLNKESEVEEYCRMVYEDNPVPIDILRIDKNKKLAQKIDSAIAQAEQLHTQSNNFVLKTSIER